MSGFKRATVTISEEEYGRLHEADMKRKFRERKKPEAQPAEQSAELARVIGQMEKRQQELEQELRELDQAFHPTPVYNEELDALLVQNALYYEDLAAMVEETGSGNYQNLENLSQSFDEKIGRQREEYQRALQNLFDRQDILEQEENAREELARQWLQGSQRMVNFLRDQFDHERFLPGRLSQILFRLEFAQNNLAQGLWESSLQHSQQAFLHLNELHLDLEQRVLEWEAEYDCAYRAIREVIHDLELNAKVTAFGLQGEELPEEVDLDYWSGGKYQELLNNCQQVLEILLQDRQQIPAEDLQRTHTEWLPDITKRLESIIYEARLNALNSQLRMNIAERALQALENHGFTLSESGYSDEDMRSSFTACLDNPDGSQVTIQVLPGDNSTRELANELVIETRHAELKTEQEVQMQWQELRRSLHADNLRISQPEIRPRPPFAHNPQVPQPHILNKPLVRSER